MTNSSGASQCYPAFLLQILDSYKINQTNFLSGTIAEEKKLTPFIDQVSFKQKKKLA